MVKAELSYNPYLLETKIKFNGEKPRINSLVEKYQDMILQDWISKIPAIFYDEMNGYDFELEFSGTVLEFEDVKKAFLNAGVDETQVKAFHKNELDCRLLKLQQIDQLLKWFGENKNRRFDYTMFLNKNDGLFNDGCNCFIINGFENENTAFDKMHLSVEYVADVHELDSTELYHTPLIICVDKKSVEYLKDNLNYVFLRKDVRQNQLFFWIHPELNEENVRRTIRDLGVDMPMMVYSVNDDKINKYLEIYPVTDYIYKVIRELKLNERKIASELVEDNEKSAIANKEIYRHIDDLDAVIKRLKVSLEKFVNRDNLELSVDMGEAKKCLIDDIQKWKKRKVKIVKENEAINIAKELDVVLKNMYSSFLQKIDAAAADAQNAVESEFGAWYRQAEFDMGYQPEIHCLSAIERKGLPDIAEKLLGLKRYVTQQKEALFDRLFKSSNDNEVQTAVEMTYYYEEWRECAVQTVEPIADRVINESICVLKQYFSELAEQYQIHLKQLLNEQIAIKEEVSAQLSEDELKLQIDNDWFAAFQDQLRNIERG